MIRTNAWVRWSSRAVAAVWLWVMMMLAWGPHASAQQRCRTVDVHDLFDLCGGAGDESPACQGLLQRCPRSDTGLDAQTLQTLHEAHTRSPDAVAAALSALARRLEQLGDAELARRVDGAVATHTAGACQDVEDLQFALVDSGGSALDCGCAWTTGRANSADHACHRLAPAEECGAVRDVSYGSWAEASVALQLHQLAFQGLNAFDRPCRERVKARLAAARTRWRNLRDHGYVQFPWELWASRAWDVYRDRSACFVDDTACTGQEGLDPERSRLILLHPSVGLGFGGFGGNGRPDLLDPDLVLAVELVGFNRYAEDFTWFFGASLGVGLLGGQFDDPRFGGFLHLTRWVHLGYLLALVDDATRYDGTIFATVDLASIAASDWLPDL